MSQFNRVHSVHLCKRQTQWKKHLKNRMHKFQRDIHSSTDDQSRREFMTSSNLLQHFEDLIGKFSCGSYDECTQAIHPSPHFSVFFSQIENQHVVLLESFQMTLKAKMCRLYLKSSSSTGIRKASVFPDPVFAAPRTSLPVKARQRVSF